MFSTTISGWFCALIVRRSPVWTRAPSSVHRCFYESTAPSDILQLTPLITHVCARKCKLLPLCSFSPVWGNKKEKLLHRGKPEEDLKSRWGFTFDSYKYEKNKQTNWRNVPVFSGVFSFKIFVELRSWFKMKSNLSLTQGHDLVLWSYLKCPLCDQ